MHGVGSIAILYVPFIIVLVVLTILSFKQQFIDIQKNVTRVLLDVTLINVCYFALLCAKDYVIVRVLYTFIFILTAWGVIELFWYIVTLAEFEKLDTKIARFILRLAFILCFFMEIPNVFGLWTISLLRFKYKGSHYYTFGIRPGHYVFMVVVFSICIFTIAVCITKIIKVASIYRRKFITFLAFYIVAVFAELYFDFVVRMEAINLTYVFFGVIAFEIYWDSYRGSHQYRSFIDHFLVDKLEVGLVMFNYTDTLESYNRRSMEWFNIEESMHGKLTREQFIKDNNIPVSEDFADQEFRFRYKKEYIEGKMEVLKEGEKTTGVFFAFYNISKEEFARIELEKYAKNRNDFIQNMTHELRTPLNAVIGFSEQLMDRMPKGEYRDQVVSIDKSGKLILRYIDEMTDMMSLSDGLYVIEKRKFNVLDEIKVSMERVSYLINDKTISFEKNVDPMTPTTLYGDANSIHVVLDNIIDNAFKYTERGKVSVETKWHQDEVTKGELEVIISDTGRGMSEEVLENIYLAFSVGQDVQHKHENGIGIGLYITKRLLDLMGGTILVESHLNIGTKVTVRIPIDVIDSTPISTTEKRANLKNVEMKLQDVKVLVVEDNAINARSIKRQLEHFDAEVTVCDSGESALEVLAKNNEFDMVFMDYIMPGLNGIETTKRIRTSGVSVSRIPIIAVTADVSEKRRESFHHAKMNDVLFKPFELVELMDILARWLPPKKVILLSKDV